MSLSGVFWAGNPFKKKKLREKKLRFNNFRIKIYNYSRKRQEKKIARARGPCRPPLTAIPGCFLRQLI
jgi:hypothetical protein